MGEGGEERQRGGGAADILEKSGDNEGDILALRGKRGRREGGEQNLSKGG